MNRENLFSREQPLPAPEPSGTPPSSRSGPILLIAALLAMGLGVALFHAKARRQQPSARHRGLISILEIIPPSEEQTVDAVAFLRFRVRDAKGGTLRLLEGESPRIAVLDPSHSSLQLTTGEFNARDSRWQAAFTPRHPGRHSAWVEVVPAETKRREMRTVKLDVAGTTGTLDTTIGLHGESPLGPLELKLVEGRWEAGTPITVELLLPDKKEKPALFRGSPAPIAAVNATSNTLVWHAPLPNRKDLRYTVAFAEPGYHRLFVMVGRDPRSVEGTALGVTIAPRAAEAPARPRWETVPGDDGAPVKVLSNAKCPIMGSAVGTVEAEEYIDYEGWRVMLCCTDCRDVFAMNPEASLRRALASVGAE